VIALAAADHLIALGVPALHLILPRQFERALHRLRASAGEENRAAVKRRSREIEQLLRELLRNFGGEVAGVRELQLRRLLGHGAHNSRVAMSDEVGDGAGGEIEILPAIPIEQPHSFPANDHGIGLIQRAMKYGGTACWCIGFRLNDRGTGIFLHRRIMLEAQLFCNPLGCTVKRIARENCHLDSPRFLACPIGIY